MVTKSWGPMMLRRPSILQRWNWLEIRWPSSTKNAYFRSWRTGFWSQIMTAIDIVEDLHRHAAVKRQQPSKVTELIQAAKRDLEEISDLAVTDALKILWWQSQLKNLPDALTEEWLLKLREAVLNQRGTLNSFLAFLKFESVSVSS